MRVGSSLICRFIRATSSCHRPRQIALAVVLGILLGTLPKTSVMFVLAAMFCYILPCHWLVLVLMALCVTAVQPNLESVLGRVGLWSLTNDRLSGLWLRLDRMPVIPWLGLHNTIVHGGLLLWAMISIPTYLVARVLAKYVITDSELEHMLDKVGVNQRSVDQRSETAEYQELRPQSARREPGKLVVVERPSVVFGTSPDRDPPVIHMPTVAADQSLSDQGSSQANVGQFSLPVAGEPETTQEVVERAASLAAWADDAINSLLSMDRVAESPKPEPIQSSTLDNTTDDDEKWLIETTMEVVRIAEQTVSQQASLKSKSTQSMSTTASPMDSVALKSNVVIRRDQTAHADQHVHMDASSSGGAPSGTNAVQQNRSDQPREEALHYLLRHLKAIQEKVKTQ